MASHVHILAAESYEGKTTEGVHVCGQRMVDEVRECGELSIFRKKSGKVYDEAWMSVVSRFD